MVPLTDPYAIYAKARDYWQRASYPAQLSYGVTISVTRNGVISNAHYHGYYDARNDTVYINATSDEEIAHPYVPHGINVGINFFGGTVPVSSPQNTFDYLGVPQIAPNYSFGIAPYVAREASVNSADLVRQIRAEFHDPGPERTPNPDAGLKTIAAIEAVRRRYVITLAGLTPIGDHTDYDLRLRPLRDPAQYRLREVWVDTDTFATDRLRTQGNFTSGEMTGIPWTVNFTQIAGAPYIASETAGAAFTLDRRAYDGATVSFTAILQARIAWMATYRMFAANPETAPEILSEPPLP